MSILTLIDNLASLWLNKRTAWKIDHSPELKEWSPKIRSMEMIKNGMEIMATSPAIAVIAEDAVKLLNAQHADNYVEFDCMPRLDRGIKPIRITVQWANKLSPAQKAARLCEELAKYDPDNPLLGSRVEP